MKKRLLSAALVLLLCLSLLPGTVLAADSGFELSSAPKIKEMEVCRDGGGAWIEVKISTPGEVYDVLQMLPLFGLADLIDRIQMNLSVNGGSWQVLDLTFNGEGDKWYGYWHTGYISGLQAGAQVSVQVRYYGQNDEGEPISSPWSEVSVAELPAETPFEFNAHDWAKAELADADALGLIPAGLREMDLKEPIIRAEFAAVSVRVYEALSGLTAEPAAVNPFTDTADAEVLKALYVGITNGLSAATFGPAELLSREQAATMLTRVYKKVAFESWTLDTDGDYAEAFRALFTMPEPFADDAEISAWARDSVYFMAANGVLNGVGDNRFGPKLVVSGEETLNHATREQAILIAVRLVKNLSA